MCGMKQGFDKKKNILIERSTMTSQDKWKMPASQATNEDKTRAIVEQLHFPAHTPHENWGINHNLSLSALYDIVAVNNQLLLIAIMSYGKLNVYKWDTRNDEKKRMISDFDIDEKYKW